MEFKFYSKETDSPGEVCTQEHDQASTHTYTHTNIQLFKVHDIYNY